MHPAARLQFERMIGEYTLAGYWGEWPGNGESWIALRGGSLGYYSEVANARQGLCRDTVRWHGAGPHRWEQVPTQHVGSLRKTTQGHAGAAHLAEHRLAARIGRVTGATFERCPVGAGRCKGVGLVMEAGNEDVQESRSISASVKPAARRASRLKGGRRRGAW